MSRVVQEFYCTKSGGGCGGYFMIKMNMGLNGVHKIICPNCKHDHQRRVEDGKIIEDRRYNGKPVDEIYAPKSSFSWNARTIQMKDRPGAANERDAVVITKPDQIGKDISHWVEFFGDRV